MKYKKKQPIIDAEQFFVNDFGTYKKDDIRTNIRYHEETKSFFIETMEGKMTIGDKDYIIRGIVGEYYPCKEDIFIALYDKCEPDV